MSQSVYFLQRHMELQRRDKWQYLSVQVHKICQLSQYKIIMGLGLIREERRILCPFVE